MMGALARYCISVLMDSEHFPVATLCVNLLGCFLLALFGNYIANVRSLSPTLISAFGAGFIGAFTTFSTFTLESVSLIQSEAYFYAGTYIFVSLFGGLIASILGYQLSVTLLVRRKRRKRFAE